jgi:hypothetical protein
MGLEGSGDGKFEITFMALYWRICERIQEILLEMGGNLTRMRSTYLSNYKIKLFLLPQITE